MSSEASESLEDFFTHQHREADALWAQVEAAAQTAEAGETQAALNRFLHAMRQHLDLEEKVLFPEFVVATGIQHGPTEIMEAEHRQMRALMELLEAAANEGDYGELLGQGDSLLMLIQQHNMKEEAMLYPMCEQSLADRWAHIRERARAFA